MSTLTQHLTLLFLGLGGLGVLFWPDPASQDNTTEPKAGNQVNFTQVQGRNQGMAFEAERFNLNEGTARLGQAYLRLDDTELWSDTLCLKDLNQTRSIHAERVELHLSSSKSELRCDELFLEGNELQALGRVAFQKEGQGFFGDVAYLNRNTQHVVLMPVQARMEPPRECVP